MHILVNYIESFSKMLLPPSRIIDYRGRVFFFWLVSQHTRRNFYLIHVLCLLRLPFPHSRAFAVAISFVCYLIYCCAHYYTKYFSSTIDPFISRRDIIGTAWDNRGPTTGCRPHGKTHYPVWATLLTARKNAVRASLLTPHVKIILIFTP